MIKTDGLKKVYRTDEVETLALAGVNLDIDEGEFVSVMGPSGCGKSTLLNVLGLLDTPTDGRYEFDGQEVGNYSERQRAQLRKGNIGFVFQSFNLIDELTVYENVELPLLYLNTPAAERQERVEAALDRAGELGLVGGALGHEHHPHVIAVPISANNYQQGNGRTEGDIPVFQAKVQKSTIPGVNKPVEFLCKGLLPAMQILSRPEPALLLRAVSQVRRQNE